MRDTTVILASDIQRAFLNFSCPKKICVLQAGALEWGQTTAGLNGEGGWKKLAENKEKIHREGACGYGGHVITGGGQGVREPLSAALSVQQSTWWHLDLG